MIIRCIIEDNNLRGRPTWITRKQLKAEALEKMNPVGVFPFILSLFFIMQLFQNLCTSMAKMFVKIHEDAYLGGITKEKNFLASSSLVHRKDEASKEI